MIILYIGSFIVLLSIIVAVYVYMQSRETKEQAGGKVIGLPIAEAVSRLRAQGFTVGTGSDTQIGAMPNGTYDVYLVEENGVAVMVQYDE